MMHITLPENTLYDVDILQFVKILHIPDFMRDELRTPKYKECGILNFNKHTEQGSHWTAWYKHGKERYYFDSFGQRPPIELEKYLKTKHELETDQPSIKRSAVTVQHDMSQECGGLCLYVLYHLFNGKSFPSILHELQIRYKKKSPLIIHTHHE